MKSLILAALILLFLLPSATLAQQTEGDPYLSLYRTGAYDKAVIVLKRETKKNASDGDAWYYLGLAYLKIGKEKDAVKALEKAAAIKSNVAEAHASLAYAYMLRNDPKAAGAANTALKLSSKNPEAHYVLGVISIRSGGYSSAYERAKKAIEFSPTLAPAYLLKSQALISSFAIQSGTVIRPKSERSEMLLEAVGDLEKYITLQPNSSEIEFHRGNLESLKFFSEYYGRPENQAMLNLNEEPDPSKTPLKISFKPPATYTDRARSANVSGIVRILVGFSADGTIKHLRVVKSLGYGLDEQSIKAARQMRFVPPTKDGIPVSAVRMLEYSFTIY